jgi:predicted O-methyltransferase YrrM
MSRFFQLKSYVNHWLDAVDEHSIHSPFFFDFYNKVIKVDDPDHQEFNAYEEVRRKLLVNPLEVTMVDLGARSPHFTNTTRALSQIAATSLSPSSYCRLYNRILHYIEATQIVELGTSMGITTLYLAQKNNVHVTSFEGNSSMVNVALTNFEYFDKKNIDLIEGNIDIRLSEFLLNPRKIHFVLMDANHHYEPTIRYFNLLSRRMADKGVIVMDDIHYSEEMNHAWKELCNHPLVYGSVDLFRCGLLFFDPALNRQHYTWSF